MSFEEFQNRARLFVIGALEPDETAEFEAAVGTTPGHVARQVDPAFAPVRVGQKRRLR